MKKTALFSLFTLEKVEKFARNLIKAGWDIIASRETVEYLSRKGIAVTDIADFTGVRENYGFPPTLHPKVEHYVTSTKGKKRIDLVYVINYPLSVGNDIGGRTLLALAAKGRRIPVMSVADMEMVVNELKKYGKLSENLHLQLLDKTNAQISSHFFDLVKERKSFEAIFGEFKYPLKNGENPYQIPAELFSTHNSDNLSLSNFKQISGESPCFTNLADSDSIIQTLSLCGEAFRKHYKKVPYICIAAKHGNPCGMAVDWNDPAVAIKNALFGNPRAIWGGEVITNFKIDERNAKLLIRSKKRKELIGDYAWMLDIVIAPCFTRKAIDILGKRRQRKLFENPELFFPFVTQLRWSYRFVRGGFLRQPPHNYILNLKDADFIGEELEGCSIDSLIIAWATAYSSNLGGNEIAIAKDRSLISCGGGSATIDAVQSAIFKAKNLGHSLHGGVFAADSFFPFIDAPQLLAEAGITAGVVPSGGKAIKDVKTFFEDNHISIFYLPEQFRGFCRH